MARCRLAGRRRRAAKHGRDGHTPTGVGSSRYRVERGQLSTRRKGTRVAEIHGRWAGGRWAAIRPHLVRRWRLLLLLLLRGGRVLGVWLLGGRRRRHGTMNGCIIDRRRARVTRVGMDGMRRGLGGVRGRRSRLGVRGVEGICVGGSSRMVFGVCGNRARCGWSRTGRVGRCRRNSRRRCRGGGRWRKGRACVGW